MKSYDMPTTAMEPTLHRGDHMEASPIFGRSLYRGIIVVFHPPTDPLVNLFGRVLALPGDRIRVISGRIELNGKQVDEPYFKLGVEGAGIDFPTVPDRYDDNQEVLRLQREFYADSVKDGVLKVPAGHYFIMGDNRGASVDSRRYGPIPLSSIVAQPILVYGTKAAGVSSLRLIPSEHLLLSR
jgi:signal peptidase I